MNETIDVAGIRGALGLTQAELAAKLSVSQSSISLWENELVPPSGPALMLLRQLEKKAKRRAAKKAG